MPGIFDPGIFDSGIFDTPASGGSGTFTAAAVIKVTRSGTFTANAVIGPAAGAFTARAVIKRNQTASLTANAIQKKTSQIPVVLTYPGFQGSNVTGNANIHAGPLRITPGTQITIRVSAQSDGNLGIVSGPTTDLASTTQNVWDDNPIGVHVFTSNSRYVWVYSFSFNGGRTGSGTATTDQTTPVLTFDAWLQKTITGSRTANAVIAPRRFTADAVLFRTTTASRPVDALIVPLRFRADAVIFRPDQLRTFTASAWFTVRVTGSFTANAIQKKTSIVPVTLVYPGVIGAGATSNANIHAGPIRITPGTAITIRVSAQSDGNLGIVAGTTNVLASTTQNTFTNTPVGTFAPTVTGSNRFVWVYSFSFNGSRTGAGTATTDQTTPVFTVDAFKGFRFRADALIKASRTGSFTVDATKGDMFFRASAVIRTTRSGSFTADARVINVPITGSFTADAIRLKTIIPVGPPGTLFLDTFSTPTSAPPFNAGTADIGGTWIWSDWDSNYNSAALSPTHVDAGGYLTVEADSYDSMYGAAPSITVGELYLDFWVPASGDTQQQFYWNDAQWWAGYQDNGATYFVTGSSANGTWPVTRSAWHRFHVIVDGATVRSHIWKVGDAEPSTYTTVQTTWPVAFTSQPTYLAQAPLIDMYFAPSTEALRIDNIQITGPGTPALTANAVKVRTQTSSKTANAVIKKLGQTGSFTADAQITQGYFRASAVIYAAGRTGSFSANAVIRLTRTGTFTADAHYNRTITGSFVANALLKVVGQPNSFTVDYATWSGVGPPPPLIGVPSRIFVNGVEITTHVMWKTASFSAKVNAQTGECTFDVVDRAHNLTFEFGDEVTLYIDGVLRWGGWIVQVNRQFPFPVLASPTTEARIFHIAGVDYNRFLDKRILHDSAHPNKTWNYPAGTYDDTIFNDLWSYFDTTGFTKNIHRVAAGVLDIPGVTARTGGNVAQGGFTMRDCLMHLSWDTGAIFYVTPQKVVTYVDADLVSNPYTLTDTPSGPMDVGFHDVRIIEDSTEMVNDAIVWGAGKGSNQVVESRYQSVPSQLDHGRWQSGNFTAGIYKQATANAVSRAAVEGSPVSLRGAKNPKRAVELLTWSPVFAIGDVVNFHDSQFFMPPADPDDAPTHDDVLPIRTMTITWPTPTAPLFALQLSWEVDAVWSFFDPWLPVGAPGLGGGGGTVLPPGTQAPPTGECDCGITDSFDRADGPPLVSDAGLTWAVSATSNGIVAISGDRLHMRSGDFNGTYYEAVSALQPAAPLSGRLVYTPISGMLGLPIIRFKMATSDLQFNNYTGSENQISSTRGSASGTTPFTLVAGTSYNVEWDETSGTHSDWRVWAVGGTRPSSPTISLSGGSPAPQTSVGIVIHINLANRHECYIENFDLDGVTRCTAPQFDTFDDRTTSNGTWGVASPSGALWAGAGPGGYTVKKVENGWGKLDQGSGFEAGQTMLITTDGIEQWGGDFTLSTAFMMQSASAGSPAAQAIGVTQSSTGFFVGQGVWVVKNDGSVNGNDKLGFVEAGVGGTYASKSWTIGVTYELRYQKAGTTHRVKSWVRGTAEPTSWDVTVTGVGVITPDQLVVFSQRESGPFLTWGVWWEYINFDYTGRPCFTDCTGSSAFVIEDDYEGRTTGPFSWGTTSDGSHTWTASGNPGFHEGTATVEVASGVGRILVPNPTDLDNNADNTQVALSGSNSTLTQSVDIYMRIQVAQQDFSIIDITPYIDFSYGSLDFNIEMGVPSGSHGRRLQLFVQGGAGATQDTFSFQLATATWYWFRLQNKLGQYAKLKYWTGSIGSEPDTWTTQVNCPEQNISSSTHLKYLVNQGGSSTTQLGTPLELLVDYLRVNPLCADVPPSGGGGVPSGTNLTEDLTPLSIATGAPPTYPANSHWQATNSILPGSAILTVGGAIQYGNWSIYDAAAGIIQYDPTLVATTTVSLTYITNGAL